jgi:hypothetical protein
LPACWGASKLPAPLANTLKNYCSLSELLAHQSDRIPIGQLATRPVAGRTDPIQHHRMAF